MKKLLLIFLTLLVTYNGNAQCVLVKNFNLAPRNPGHPHHLTVFDNKLICFALDGFTPNYHGFELWAMDSTGNWTMHDINAGNGNGAYDQNPSGSSMAVMGSYVYFPADNGTSGFELYKWDGNTAPTLAYDVRPGMIGSSPAELTVLNGKVYFVAETPLYGKELWVYDPVTSIASLAADIFPGTTDGYPQGLIVFNNKLYFQARSSAYDYELFMYNPISGTTMAVADINTGINGSYPNSFEVLNNKLYFSATTTAQGSELFSCDTSNTVTRLTDINPNGGGSLYGTESKHAIGMLNNKLYFAVVDSPIGQKLYQYDPISGMSTMISAINSGPSISHTNVAMHFSTYNGKLYFEADDGVHGYELWVYDGINPPTMVIDLYPGALGAGAAFMTIYRGELYFTATGGDSISTELYKLGSGSSGIIKTNSNTDIKIYPNPAKDKVSIEWNSNHTTTALVIVTDVTGKIVSKTTVEANGKAEVNFWQLQKGIYFVTIESDGSRQTQKLVLE